MTLSWGMCFDCAIIITVCRLCSSFSQLLFFSVAPYCVPNQKWVEGVARNQMAKISCQVRESKVHIHFFKNIISTRTRTNWHKPPESGGKVLAYHLSISPGVCRFCITKGLTTWAIHSPFYRKNCTIVGHYLSKVNIAATMAQYGARFVWFLQICLAGLCLYTVSTIHSVNI